jgi:hypothetical protein
METCVAAFVRAVYMQSGWVSDYIREGQPDQAEECALAMRERAGQILIRCESCENRPAPPEGYREMPLTLLSSEKTMALTRALRQAAELAKAVDAERSVPYEGSFGELMEGLAAQIEAEAHGPVGLRGWE